MIQSARCDWMPLKQSPPCQKLLQEEERSWTTCRSLRARPRTPVRPSERPSGSPSKSSPGNPSWVTAHKRLQSPTTLIPSMDYDLHLVLPIGSHLYILICLFHLLPWIHPTCLLTSLLLCHGACKFVSTRLEGWRLWESIILLPFRILTISSCQLDFVVDSRLPNWLIQLPNPDWFNCQTDWFNCQISTVLIFNNYTLKLSSHNSSYSAHSSWFIFTSMSLCAYVMFSFSC